MKKIITVFAALLFFPSVSSAAALTSQQANSLIAVVQSSPGTPADAFTNLITAFSNITVAQADSLIVVVQAATGVPASAFVNLLTSFTVDTPITQLATPVVTLQPTQDNQNTPSLATLSVTLGNLRTTINSAHVVWDTNLPTDSKIFLTQGGVTQIIPSESGNSTHHIVDITSLLSGTQYSYIIEAINGIQDQKISGVFTTLLPAASGIVVWNGRGENYVNNYVTADKALASSIGSNCGTSFFSVGVLDQFGNYMQNQQVIFTNPETGVQTTRPTGNGGGTPLQEPAAIFSYTPQVATGSEPILLSSGNVNRTIDMPIISVGPINVQNGWQQESATEWQNMSSGQRFDTSTGKCL